MHMPNLALTDLSDAVKLVDDAINRKSLSARVSKDRSTWYMLKNATSVCEDETCVAGLGRIRTCQLYLA